MLLQNEKLEYYFITKIFTLAYFNRNDELKGESYLRRVRFSLPQRSLFVKRNKFILSSISITHNTLLKIFLSKETGTLNIKRMERKKPPSCYLKFMYISICSDALTVLFERTDELYLDLKRCFHFDVAKKCMKPWKGW